MKLRLKGEAFAKQVLTEFDSNTVTVAELKFRVRDILQLHDEDFLGSIQFSMNGKQALLAEDTELVSNLGFISGDAVYVLGTFSETSKSIRGYTTMLRPREIFFPSPFHSPRVYPDVNGVHEFPGIMGGYSDLYPDLRGFGPPGRRQPFRNLPEGGVGFPRPLGRFRGFPNI